MEFDVETVMGEAHEEQRCLIGTVALVDCCEQAHIRKKKECSSVVLSSDKLDNVR